MTPTAPQPTTPEDRARDWLDENCWCTRHEGVRDGITITELARLIRAAEARGREEMKERSAEACVGERCAEKTLGSVAYNNGCRDCAAAIRALPTKGKGGGTERENTEAAKRDALAELEGFLHVTAGRRIDDLPATAGYHLDKMRQAFARYLAAVNRIRALPTEEAR